MIEIVRTLPRKLERLSQYPEKFTTGAEGIVYFVDERHIAKIFTGEPEEALQNASNQFTALEECYREGMSVPKPICILPRIYPTPKHKTDSKELPSYTIIMENISDGRELRELDPDPERREARLRLYGRSRLLPDDLKRAEDMYWAQLRQAHNIGWIVRDSAPHWNVLWSPSRGRTVLIDQVRWEKASQGELEQFLKEHIEKRHMPVDIELPNLEIE